ncbi:zinc finger protein [Cinnamomum micranthum f. kanehirae]|uniref:RING-type E3 ubiquitin transferase n=1 Tax=Cinnamomum micranthum f. kanehirae TaxID=337451 RepID=A0A3S3N369_9MAGN|nr:zinc finger protein [Cinnamomum micranthum f. kanehirae]
MDGCTSKRTTGRLGIVKRGSASSFKDLTHEEDNKSIRCANRIGCNTRLKSMKGTQIGNPNPEKDKCLRLSFRSSSSNAILGNSSKPYAGRGNLQKPLREQQNRASLKETVLTESRRRHGEAEVSESSSLTAEVLTEHPQNEETESVVRQDFSVNTGEEVGSSNVTSGSGAKKQIYKRIGLRSVDTSFGSSASVRRSSLSTRNSGQVAKSLSPSQGPKAHRDGLRNDRYASVSDSHLSGNSSPDSGNGRTGNTIRKRCPVGETSSATKATTRLSTAGNSISQRRNGPSRPSLSFHEGSSSQQASGKSKNWSASSNVGAAVRTRRMVSADSRTRVPARANNNYSSLTEPILPHELSRTEALVSGSTTPSSSQSFRTEFRSSFHNSCGRLDSSSETLHSSPISQSEDGSSTRALHGHSVDRDSFRRINMDGVAEVLLALERIEHDADLTYEQLLVLETNLLLGGLGLHDQHRDMRLDIDNMSYEELLALEERMGTVSTALPEEALSKCLKRSCYTPTALFPGLAGCGEDDTKCSICQEEYEAGDEMGKLGCEHRYHLDCINQWLRLKNWCPICKAAASPS